MHFLKCFPTFKIARFLGKFKGKQKRNSKVSLNEIFISYFLPIFEYKIGRGSERKRATEPRKKNTKMYIVGGKDFQFFRSLILEL